MNELSAQHRVAVSGHVYAACLSRISLMVIWCLEAVVRDQRIALRFGEVGGHHLGHKIVEGNFGYPAQFRSGFGGVAQEGFDFGRAEVFWVDAHDWGADIR
jgi:hypothetical protein